MASEIHISYTTGRTLYFHVRSRTGTIWNTSGTGAFETYQTSAISSYKISATEQGTASQFYAGSFPTAIPAGTYSIVAKLQMSGSPQESDPTIAMGNQEWNGTATTPLSDLASSGQVGQLLPVRFAYGEMVQNFPLYFKSSLDHVTPFTSGIVSGQIIRNSGVFGPLQSGAFVEAGLGFYNLQALTSGDMAGKSIKLLFTCVGISGGQADPLPFSIITQRTSGQ